MRVTDVELVATAWHVLRRTTFEQRDASGTWMRKSAETYDRGNGATILLYDRERRTVLLTRQFRSPSYVNEHPDGMLIEAAAGLLDDDDAPEAAIRREAIEETGHEVGELEHVFDVYIEPGFRDRTDPLLRGARTPVPRPSGMPAAASRTRVSRST